jgi:hypothetical protein
MHYRTALLKNNFICFPTHNLWQFFKRNVYKFRIAGGRTFFGEKFASEKYPEFELTLQAQFLRCLAVIFKPKTKEQE